MIRFFGWMFSLIGASAFGLDLLASRHTDRLMLRPIGDYWYRMHPESLQLAQPAIERHVAPWLWESVILRILQLPAAPTFLGLGLAFLFLSIRRSQ